MLSLFTKKKCVMDVLEEDYEAGKCLKSLPNIVLVLQPLT